MERYLVCSKTRDQRDDAITGRKDQVQRLKTAEDGSSNFEDDAAMTGRKDQDQVQRLKTAEDSSSNFEDDVRLQTTKPITC